MRRYILSIILAAFALLCAFDSAAQRRINPVTPPPATTGTKKEVKKEEVDKSRLAETRDSKGNVVLVDTVTGSEYIDSTGIVPPVGNIYPLMHAVTVGVDVWDPVMKILGTEYGGISFWGELSLHNRFKPIFEFGMSSADIKPDGMNYTFKSPMAPFFKLGMNYNIFYNSNPAYQLLFGIRYAFTPYKWSIENALPNGEYWPAEPFSIPDQSATTGYLELVASIKVQIFKNISLGWQLKYHSILHESKNQYGKPMYIPGFGKRGTPIAGGFSVMYTLPLNKKALPKVNTTEGTATNGTLSE